MASSLYMHAIYVMYMHVHATCAYVEGGCVYMMQIFIRSLVVAGLVLDGTFIIGPHYSPSK